MDGLGLRGADATAEMPEMTEPRRRSQRIDAAGPPAGAPLAGEAVFGRTFRAAPYWHEDLPPAPALPRNLPPSAEVVVIGSGYTGLHAALQTARGGRATVVLEAGDPGWGCSTRNGGHISSSVKPSFAELARRHGADRARRIRSEGVAALDWIGDFVAAEGIDCGFRRSGRFHAAHTPERYEAIARAAET